MPLLATPFSARLTATFMFLIIVLPTKGEANFLLFSCLHFPVCLSRCNSISNTYPHESVGWNCIRIMLIYIPVYFWDNALWIGLREVENAADTQIGLIQTDGKTLIFPHTHDRNVDEDNLNEIQGVFFFHWASPWKVWKTEVMRGYVYLGRPRYT